MRTVNSDPELRPVVLSRLYGLTLASDFPFRNKFPPGSGSPDLWFRRVQVTPVHNEWQTKRPVFTSKGRTDDGEPFLSVYRDKGYDVVTFASLVNFYLWPEKIIAEVLDPSHDHVIEIRFLGEIFSIWLELQGVPTVHASAVVVEDGAVGFMCTNKGGKSALAAAMMVAGCPLLTDDILPLEVCDGTVIGRPGYPQMRMWPDEADFFFGGHANLEIVHPWYSKRRVPVGDGGFGRFCDGRQPLKALYIPERTEDHDPITIDPVPPSDALFELVSHSFSARIVEALGLQVPRMNFFATLVMQIPVRRVRFPSGFQNLSRVRDAIFKDLKEL